MKQSFEASQNETEALKLPSFASKLQNNSAGAEQMVHFGFFREHALQGLAAVLQLLQVAATY